MGDGRVVGEGRVRVVVFVVGGVVGVDGGGRQPGHGVDEGVFGGDGQGVDPGGQPQDGQGESEGTHALAGGLHRGVDLVPGVVAVRGKEKGEPVARPAGVVRVAVAVRAAVVVAVVMPVVVIVAFQHATTIQTAAP